MPLECTKFETKFLADAFAKHAEAVRAADAELRKIVRLAVESRDLDPSEWGVKVEEGAFVFMRQDEAEPETTEE